jgi:cellulose synthase/poly-beta-1,6-N-acetylglucosamine synthase-like glycosyltransferase
LAAANQLHADLSAYLWARFRFDANIDWFAKVKELPKDYQNYHHLIFLPTYKEPYQVVKKLFDALINSNYDQRKFIVVLAGEERDQENFLAIADKIKEEFASHFLDLLVTVHPKDIPVNCRARVPIPTTRADRPRC